MRRTHAIYATLYENNVDPTPSWTGDAKGAMVSSFSSIANSSTGGSQSSSSAVHSTREASICANTSGRHHSRCSLSIPFLL